ncbi:MAG: hypothetical protein HYZ21_03730 [Chloroflexi bacterium]|nr:hypothetical protein [Chloroflexota bacterium]
MAGRNKKDSLRARDNSIVIGGNVQGSNVVVGNNNKVVNQTINIAPLFDEIYKKVDLKKELNSDEKNDVKAELQEIQTALEQPNPDESFLARRFRNLKRMAPEITEIAFETLKNPIGGVAEVIKRIAKKAAEEAAASAK